MASVIERRFSAWYRWTQRRELPRCGSPGVYAIARTREDIAEHAFALRDDIIYFGMTIASHGLQGRLQQFDYTISGKRLAHGGADRVRHGYASYSRLTPRLYVSVAPFACDPASGSPRDLRKMGDVARFEYLCIAAYVESHGKMPRFNDKANAPKYSKRA
jgi:hypothetical protein